MTAESHPGAHDHDETKVIDTDHGQVLLSIFETGVPPRFRLHFLDRSGQPMSPPPDQVHSVETLRSDGTRHVFTFSDREGNYLEATETLPEPHEFEATLRITDAEREHTYELRFVEHDHGHEHPHVHGHGDTPDRVAFVYSGVSVGAATVHMVAFQLVVDVNPNGGPSRIAQRRVLSRRGAVSTPYLPDGSLDLGALGFALLEAGATAPVMGEGIDGRVAVLSGLAVEEHNAYWIGRALTDIDYTPYTCLRAGPHLGAVLAAYGGDAVARSVDAHGEPRVVLNVDIGASTAKLALCRGGDILETAAIAVGTRMVVMEADGTLGEFRPSAARAADAVGVRLDAGAPLSEKDQRALADELVECLFNVIERRALEPLSQALMLTDPLKFPDRINSISFTGGGAEYIFENQEKSFDDLGPVMGRAVRQRLNRLGVAVHEPEHLLRATLVGGAQYRVADVHDSPTFSEPSAFAAARALDAAFVPHSQAATAAGA